MYPHLGLIYMMQLWREVLVIPCAFTKMLLYREWGYMGPHFPRHSTADTVLLFCSFESLPRREIREIIAVFDVSQSLVYGPTCIGITLEGILQIQIPGTQPRPRSLFLNWSLWYYWCNFFYLCASLLFRFCLIAWHENYTAYIIAEPSFFA